MKIMSKINITNLGRPKLTARSAMVFKAPYPEVSAGSTSSVGVSRLSSDYQMLLEEKK